LKTIISDKKHDTAHLFYVIKVKIYVKRMYINIFFSVKETFKSSRSIREIHKRPMLICDTILGNVYTFEGKNYQ